MFFTSEKVITVPAEAKGSSKRVYSRKDTFSKIFKNDIDG